MEVELARHGASGRPDVEVPPRAVAGVEDPHLRKIPRALVLEPIVEPRLLDLRTEVLARVAAKGDVAERVAMRARPFAVKPRPQHEIVEMLTVTRLPRRVGGLRTVEIFLIPRAAHRERRHRGEREIA